MITTILILVVLVMLLDENDVVFITHRKLRKTKAKLLRRKAAREEARNGN